MTKGESSPISQMIPRIDEEENPGNLPDQALINGFKEHCDESVFRKLLFRHGPMVWGVCRAALNNDADAEDAFQATFLILARKAGSIRKTESLGSWLHGVAYRTALKARAKSSIREKNEASTSRKEASDPDDMEWREVQQIMHEELTGLAEKYRGPLVVCYFQGKTQEEAASQLGIATSTLKERLERGRAMLRTRLMRRGLGSMAILTAAVWPPAASASISVALVSKTVVAGIQFANGKAATAIVPAKVAALTNTMLNALFFTKLKVVGTVLVGIALIGAGVSIFSIQGLNHSQSTIIDTSKEELDQGKSNLGFRPFDKGRIAKQLREQISVFGPPDHEEKERKGKGEDSSGSSLETSFNKGKK